MKPVPRSPAQCKADTLTLLRTEVDCWVASADEMGNAHVVPLSVSSSETAMRAKRAMTELNAVGDVILTEPRAMRVLARRTTARPA